MDTLAEEIVRKNRFIPLLAALALLLIITPIWRLLFPGASSEAGTTVIGIAFVVMLIFATYAVARGRRFLVISVALAVPVALLQVVSFLFDSDRLLLADSIASVVFLAYIAVQGLRYLFTVRQVTMDTIAASLCIYLLLALAWAAIYTITELLAPGSYVVSRQDAASGGFVEEGSGVALYFSLVTISTLGYGDITPTTPVARLFAASQAVCGQLYLAVLVARLVGLQIAWSLQPGKDEGRQ
jgi:hypothetical protein